jgi:hypothetical protein
MDIKPVEQLKHREAISNMSAGPKIAAQEIMDINIIFTRLTRILCLHGPFNGMER